jgi:epoxyqueuosine reductase
MRRIFLDWLSAGFNGEMAYMSRHGVKRSRPAELLPGTVSCVSVRMDYWPKDAADAEATLADGSVAYVSRYALGRDYHKLMRARLQKLCDRIRTRSDPSATGCSPTARRFWKRLWRAMPAWAGSASTPI